VTRYELLDRIGVGGMAEIFRGKAVAAGGFEKPVAIKRILPHLSQDKRFVELLIAEAKVLSLLRHRNIVQIFDVGLGDDAQYFLVMEYVDGKDLGAVQRGLESRRKKLAFDLALHIVAEICEALEHAHTARAPDGKAMALVHRDVSPTNVLLSRAGEVKLTDFGIAKRAESEQTGHGAVRGKFAYISPEQARNEQVGPRSDVFSVGILLWELVCNRRLFSGLPDLEALRAVREPTAIQRPSEVDPRIVRAVDDIVLMALQRDRERRPTAAQLGQQLRSLRYSLETTVGDPAAELARVIDTAEQVARETTPPSAPSTPRATGFDSMDPAEMTVIRIRTADEFSQRDNDRSIAQARKVIDRFEEEETRLAQLSVDQLRKLRSGAGPSRDSSEISVATPPRPDVRSRRPTQEPTQMREPVDSPEWQRGAGLDSGEQPTVTGGGGFDRDATKLVAPRDRRTPVPERRSPAPPQRRATEVPPVAAQSRRPAEVPHVPPSSAVSPVVPLPPSVVPSRDAPGRDAPMAMPQPGFPPPEPPSSFPLPPPAMPPPGSYPVWSASDPQGGYSPMPVGMQPSPGGYAPAAGPASAFKPWMLVVGAVIMALLAFAITRTLISG
jgi:serine/threonine protein kinase